MTEAGIRTGALDTRSFYDALSPLYDEMTSFEKRLTKEQPFFELLVGKYKITSALDAGSGTGFHSLLLTGLGVDVTAVDVSEKMLQRLREHLVHSRRDVRTVCADLRDLGGILNPVYNGVFVMGNTLAHLPDEKALDTTIRTLAGLLLSGGTLVIQNVNFDRIMAQHDKIQSVRESGDTTFVRYYEYRNDALEFNILSLRKQSDAIEEIHLRTSLRPLYHGRMVSLLTNAGFSSIESYGSITMDPFSGDTSPDLVLIARKPGRDEASPQDRAG